MVLNVADGLFHTKQGIIVNNKSYRGGKVGRSIQG